MKHLLRLTILTGLCMAAVHVSGASVSNMVAHVGADNVTSNDVRFAEGMRCSRALVKGRPSNVLIAYHYLEVLDAHLDQIVSPEFQMVRWGKVMKEGLTLREFLLSEPFDLEGPTSIISLSAVDFKGSRSDITTSWHIMVWMGGVKPFGYTDEDLLTHEQAEALKPVIEE